MHEDRKDAFVDSGNTPPAGIVDELAPTEAEQSFFYATQWQLMWWNFKKHKVAVVAGIVIIIMYSMALVPEFVAPYTPSTRDRNYANAPPQRLRFMSDEGLHLRPFVYGLTLTRDPETLERNYAPDRQDRRPIRFFVKGVEYKLFGFIPADRHLFGIEDGMVFLFGTDRLGRDMFSRVIYASRISMSIGLVGVFLSFILGLILGGIAGYVGGAADNIIQRVSEILLSFPSIPLWMGLSAAIPPHWSPVRTYFAITVILSIIGWTRLGRQVRSKIMSLKNEDFVVAAQLAGTSETKIVARHLIPSFMSHIIAVISLAIPTMILAETSLSFLGIGLRPPTVSWGVLLQQAQNLYTLTQAPWLMIPGAFVIVFVLAFSFLGDGLRDAADPYGGMKR